MSHDWKDLTVAIIGILTIGALMGSCQYFDHAERMATIAKKPCVEAGK